MPDAPSVNETVTRMIRGFPSLFENRTQALHHLFCVLGGGYEWEGGALVDVFEHLHDDRDEQEAVTLVKVCEPFEWLKDRDPDEYQQMVVAADVERARLKAIRDNAAELAETPGPLGQDPYPASPRIPLNLLPDNVRPDWAAAAAEIATVVEALRLSTVPPTPDLNAEQIHKLVINATPAVLSKWVDEGVDAWHERPDEWGEILPLDDQVRVILAGVLPHIVEHIAQQIEAVDPAEWALAGQRAGQDAARIVRASFETSFGEGDTRV